MEQQGQEKMPLVDKVDDTNSIRQNMTRRKVGRCDVANTNKL